MKSETDVGVVVAGARALIALGDLYRYNVYYAVLTGERKSGEALLEDQKKMLKDPKKMAQFGFKQGIGFIPFAGLGYGRSKRSRRTILLPFALPPLGFWPKIPIQKVARLSFRLLPTKAGWYASQLSTRSRTAPTPG